MMGKETARRKRIEWGQGKDRKPGEKGRFWHGMYFSLPVLPFPVVADRSPGASGPRSGRQQIQRRCCCCCRREWYGCYGSRKWCHAAQCLGGQKLLLPRLSPLMSLELSTMAGRRSCPSIGSVQEIVCWVVGRWRSTGSRPPLYHGPLYLHLWRSWPGWLCSCL